MRLALVIGSPHTTYRLGTTLRQGSEGLRANVEVDDFQQVGEILKPLQKMMIIADTLVIFIMCNTLFVIIH